MNKKIIIIIICLALFFITGIYLESSSLFSGARKGFQDRTIPSPLLNFGKRGRIMEKLGLKYIVPMDSGNTDDNVPGNLRSAGNFHISKRLSDNGYLKYEDMESSILDQKTINQPISILSITADKYDLYDEAVGIYANYDKKGRNWERPCYISYYENGKLLFATGAGIRIHGGTSRKSKIKSFRLYFRSIYGENQFKSGTIFSKECDPIKHLVVRNDSGGGNYFMNALPYDISRESGCQAPFTKPVKLYLNGSSHGHGYFLLIEHLSREYIMTHYGYDNFIFYRLKGEKGMPVEYKNLVKWAKNKKGAMTIEEAAKYVSLENLSRWWITNLFCANTDPYQGVALLDLSRKDGTWFWINWDMDHSFRNRYNEKVSKIWEQEKVLRDFVNKASKATKNDPRAVLFRRLMNEDPAFRGYFEKELMLVLNHRLTKRFLESRLKYYENTIRSFGITDNNNIIREFTMNRHPFFMKLMKKYFNSPDAFTCLIKVPDKINLQIDGYKYNKDYTGLYFDGSQIQIKPDKKIKISYWLVNGRKQLSTDGSLAVTINSETTIEPVTGL